MKKKKPAIDLDQEYVSNAAAQARKKEREELARWEAGAMAREADRRRLAADEAQRTAQPIEDRDKLAAHVAELAAAFGLKRRRR